MQRNRGRKYILISESKVGVHAKAPFEEFRMFAFTFVPRVTKDRAGRFSFTTNVQGIAAFAEAVALYKNTLGSGADPIILVGYDLDLMGEAMSAALKENLIMAGVDPFDIIRMPLTEKGYVMMKMFPDLTEYKKFLYLDHLYMKHARSALPKGSRVFGIRKTMAIRYLCRHRGATFNLAKIPGVNSKGTSMATFISKRIMRGEV